MLTDCPRDAAYLGFAKSKFVSTQWTAEFTRAVYARPIILISKLAPGEGISALGEAKCEPCNHRNHHPSYALQFTGKPYHKATLEEIDSDSDDPDEEDEDEDGSDSDRASVNSQGMALCSVDKIWMSGRYVSYPPHASRHLPSKTLLMPNLTVFASKMPSKLTLSSTGAGI